MEKIVQRVSARFTVVAGLGIGETSEQGTVRLHRYRDHLTVTDLAFAGKRGKKCARLSVGPSYQKGAEKVFEEVVQGISRLREYGAIKDAVQKAEKDHPLMLRVEEYMERGVDVLPFGFQPINRRGQYVDITVSLKDFTVQNIDDQFNLPTCIPAVKGSPGDVPAFFRWVQDNPDKVQKWTFRQIVELLGQLGISTHEYCAMD